MNAAMSSPVCTYQGKLIAVIQHLRPIQKTSYALIFSQDAKKSQDYRPFSMKNITRFRNIVIATLTSALGAKADIR